MNSLFKIMSFTEAVNYVKSFPSYFNVISADVIWYVPPRICRNHLHLQINDVEYVSDELIEEYMPTKKLIQQAIDFDKSYPVDIIHCWAGLSRSPALGYAILRARNYSAQEAMNTIKTIAPFSEPNRLIVSLTNEMFPDRF